MLYYLNAWNRLESSNNNWRKHEKVKDRERWQKKSCRLAGGRPIFLKSIKENLLFTLKKENVFYQNNVSLALESLNGHSWEIAR